MFPIQFDVAETAQRNRVTVLFRAFAMIPHMIVVYLWNIANSAVMIIQWFIIMFTGKRNQGLFDFQKQYMGYAANVYSYGALLHDKFPAFGPNDPASPVRYDARFEEKGNRLTTFFRYILSIPAMVIAMLYGIVLYVLIIVSWFVIVITGRQPSGIFAFMKKAMRLFAGVMGYYTLMTDQYPWPGAVEAGAPSFGSMPSAGSGEAAPWK